MRPYDWMAAGLQGNAQENHVWVLSLKEHRGETVT